MQKGLISRYIIFQILKSLKNEKINYDSIYLKKIKNKKINSSDIKLIQNVVLTSMRYNLEIDQILKIYVKKINKNSNSYFLILSSIAQIVFLNFKDYAVINSSVEIAKNKKFLKIYPAFINGLLRNIARNKKKLFKIKVSFSMLPQWFINQTNNWNEKQKTNFVKTIKKEPNIHLVFKSSEDLDKFKLSSIKTTENSLVIKKATKIKNLPKYREGVWWIQDFSSMMPLFLLDKKNSKKVLDMCAAPGGKTIQLICSKAEVVSYDKNKNKVSIMKENLHRLNFNNEVINKDSLKINSKDKFDMVIIDAPCSSIGTIRRNPEIFYRHSSPNFQYIIPTQYKFLNKAKDLVKNNGIIIYMVCSFLSNEGDNQIERFLSENKNFSLVKYFSKNRDIDELINEKGFFKTYPINFRNKFLIDGFFAAQLQKNA
jgi:16S rRNA (cytosine967-C5)-methyltransferase